MHIHVWEHIHVFNLCSETAQCMFMKFGRDDVPMVN